MCEYNVVGMFIGNVEGSGGFRSIWYSVELYDGRMVSYFTWGMDGWTIADDYKS